MSYITGKSGYFEFQDVNKQFTWRINWAEQYDIALNSSVITITVDIHSKVYIDRWYPNAFILVNGEQVAEFNYYKPTHFFRADTSDYVSLRVYTTGEPLFSCQSSPIVHNADGTKSITVSVVNNPAGHNLSSIQLYRSSDGILKTFGSTQSIEVELTDIPRSSSFALSSYVVDVGDDIIVDISRAASKFKHIVEFYIDDTYYQKYTDVEESQMFTIPETWYYAMPSSVNCTAYCRVTTYDGDTQIGTPSRNAFTVNVPSNIAPVVGDIMLTPSKIKDNDILVKGKNALTISVSDCSSGIGSNIKSYSFYGPSVSNTISSTLASASTTIQSVSEYGELTYTVKVTDTRGRTSSRTNTIICYDYYAPSFNSFSAYRSDEYGIPNINGTYIKCDFTINYASVNNTNSAVVASHYNESILEIDQDSNIIDLDGDINTTYKVYLTIADNYGGYDKTEVITVFGQSRVLNITVDGTGIAIGKMAESPSLFECRWPAKFNDDVSCELITSKKVDCDEFVIGQKTIFDLIYPVGSIYMSVNDVSPEILFGGSWEQLKDRFLLSAGDSYDAGSVGGEAEHIITIDETPSHTHTFTGSDITHDHGTYQRSSTASSNPTYDTLVDTQATGEQMNGWGFSMNAYSNRNQMRTTETTLTASGSNENTGGGQAHNNMPPYLAVYMWKRVG